MEDYKYILPQEGSITANDCSRLLAAIQAGKLDEFDLKNEINAQWTKGYNFGRQQAKKQAQIDFDFWQENIQTLKTLIKNHEKSQKETS
tara:strand:+ start:237 stop:503 length:267 start_codon:yes stop_codon:yes gene_type:complete